MKKLRQDYTKNPVSISYKIVLLLLIFICIIGLISGIAMDRSKTLNAAEEKQNLILTPCQKENGTPFCISIVEIEPPIESSYLWLRGFVKEMIKNGYITADLNFETLPKDYEGLYKALLNMDLGSYITFDETCYILSEKNASATAKELQQKVEKGQIDLIIGSGTDAGLFLKELDLKIPMLVAMATDPVASGIIKSPTNTGDPNIWALTEDNPMGRQLEAYQRIFGFKKLGMIIMKEFEEIAAVPQYEKTAKKLGIELTKVYISQEISEKEQESALKSAVKKIETADIDAFLLTFGVIGEEVSVSQTFRGLEEKGVPILVSDGSSYVKNGGLICISSYDYEGYGQHAAKIASSVFNGKKPGELSCRYTPVPPILYLIKKLRKKLDLKPALSFSNPVMKYTK